MFSLTGKQSCWVTASARRRQGRARKHTFNCLSVAPLISPQPPLMPNFSQSPILWSACERQESNNCGGLRSQRQTEVSPFRRLPSLARRCFWTIGGFFGCSYSVHTWGDVAHRVTNSHIRPIQCLWNLEGSSLKLTRPHKTRQTNTIMPLLQYHLLWPPCNKWRLPISPATPLQRPHNLDYIVKKKQRICMQERKTHYPTSLASTRTVYLFSIHRVGVTVLYIAFFLLLFYTAWSCKQLQ